MTLANAVLFTPGNTPVQGRLFRSERRRAGTRELVWEVVWEVVWEEVREEVREGMLSIACMSDVIFWSVILPTSIVNYRVVDNTWDLYT